MRFHKESGNGKKRQGCLSYGIWQKKIEKNKVFATGGYIDYQTIFLVVVLLAFGVMMVYSASAYRATLFGLPSGYFAMRQGMIGLAGIVVMMLISCFNYQFYKRPVMQRLIVTAMIVCAGIALVLGVSSNGSQRWIEVGGIQLQPSEIVKLLIILYLPSVCVKHPKYLTSYQGIIRLIAPCIVSAGLIAKENLSTAVVCVAIMVVIIFVACPDYKILVMPVVALVIAGVLLITTVGYRGDRIDAWLHPETSDSGYQTMQSLYAIGSGGLFGKGLGQSIQKLGFLPESHNDMIFAIICEELGLFGALCVIALFVMLIVQLRYIANHARDRYGALVVTGVMTHIAVQMIINIGVVTNVIPNTGVPLPFISYGGTSLAFLMVEMGFVLSVSRQMLPYEAPTKEELQMQR